MRVFMLGWEFPPFISGGLGTACYGLTKALSSLGTDIIFVLPRPLTTPFSSHTQLVESEPSESTPEVPKSEIRLDEFEHVSFRTIDAQKSDFRSEPRIDEFKHVTFRAVDAQVSDPYLTPHAYQKQYVELEQARKQASSGPAGAAQSSVPPVIGAPPPAAAAPFIALPKSPKPEVRSAEPLVSPAAASTFSSTMTPATPATVASATSYSAAPVILPAAAPTGGVYAGDLFSEIARYAKLAAEIGRQEHFDVVHAHDWMTFPAGMAIAAAKGVPLVVHVHSTEFDRSGSHVDERIYDIERRGMHAAMKVIAVSHLTGNQITHRYGIDAKKVEIIHNGIEPNGALYDAEKYKIHKDEKIVLFLGRITQQKGPEYFLGAAKKVLEVMDKVKFVIAGGGDLTRRTIEMASQMGIGHKVLFTGFLRGADVDRVFKMADLYVMPSLSEPFGIAPLEAMSHDVPVLISKQSGVSEIIKHALKVDFWDTTEMANKIVAVLKHPPLASTLRQHGSFEVRQLSWLDAARAVQQVYDEAQSMVHGEN